MYWVDNGTGVMAPPTIPPVQSSVRQYFTEGGQGQQPTIPGGDWFNMVTDELISVLTAAEITPTKGKHNQLITAFNVIMLDFIDVVFPVGIPFSWPLAELPPSKYGITFGKCNGAAFSGAQYPKLAKIFPSLRVPDLRGDVIRALDDGKGVDPGRILLSHQYDAIPNITGFISGSGMSFDDARGAFRLGSLITGKSASSTSPTGLSDDLDFDISRVVRTGPEVTVKNTALLKIMRYS